MKRIISILLILLMLAGLATPVYAADATASTMRLSETEGSVTVENASGKELTLRDNLRLYNGYSIATEQESYAYISLDKSKAAKLDASSAAEVSKSGKKLELNVTAGSLMFNVPVSLEADESMNIRTSSMVAGIRGTSGWVHVLGRYTTRVSVLEGSVTVSSHHPLTGEPRSVTITGGQTVTIIDHARAEQMTQELINQGTIVEANIVEALTELGQVVEALNEDSVPGFVAAAIASDPPLREEINNNSPLDADKIAENAEQKLREDQQEAKAQTLALEQQLENMAPADEIPQSPFAPGGALNQTETVVITETVVAPGETVYVEVEKEVIKEVEKIVVVEKIVEIPGETIYVDIPAPIDCPTTDTVNEIFADTEYTGPVSISNPGTAFDITQIVMNTDDHLYIVGGTIAVDNAWTSTGNITLLDNAKLSVSAPLTVPSTSRLNFSTDSILTISASGSIESATALTFAVGSTVTNNGSILSVGNLEIDGELSNNGSIVAGGSVYINGDVTNESNGYISTSGNDLYVNGYLENNGSINLSAPAARISSSSSSMLCVSGTFYNNSNLDLTDAYLIIDGYMYNYGSIIGSNSELELGNSGILYNCGTLEYSDNSYIYVYGNLLNYIDSDVDYTGNIILTDSIFYIGRDADDGNSSAISGYFYNSTEVTFITSEIHLTTTLNNNGTINLASSYIAINGQLDNYGVINAADFAQSAAPAARTAVSEYYPIVSINASGTIYNYGNGVFVIGGYYEYDEDTETHTLTTNESDIYYYAELMNYGRIYNNGLFYNSGLIENNGYITNGNNTGAQLLSVDISFYPETSFINAYDLLNYGVIENKGYFENTIEGYIWNYAELINYSHFHTTGYIIANGDYYAYWYASAESNSSPPPISGAYNYIYNNIDAITQRSGILQMGEETSQATYGNAPQIIAIGNANGISYISGDLYIYTGTVDHLTYYDEYNEDYIYDDGYALYFDYKIKTDGDIPIYCEDSSAILTADNPSNLVGDMERTLRPHYEYYADYCEYYHFCTIDCYNEYGICNSYWSNRYSFDPYKHLIYNKHVKIPYSYVNSSSPVPEYISNGVLGYYNDTSEFTPLSDTFCKVYLEDIYLYNAQL